MNTYQSHDECQVSISDTQLKLTRIQLAEDLSGKSFLDIGCNEGYFCNLAVKRGAARVVGIDFVKQWIDDAQNRYGDRGIDFRNQKWDTLPEGPFDVVLWLSAMHYETDPATMFDRIREVLAPGGLLILECGVIDIPRKEMAYIQRGDGSLWYPTLPMLDEFLKNYAVRRVAFGKLTEGDPVPRSVFHCTKRCPVVLLVRGTSTVGKTALSSELQSAATKVIGLDYFISRIWKANFQHNKLQQFIKEHCDPSDLSKLYLGIDEAGLTEDYTELLSQSVQPSDRLVVIEGFLTDAQASALTQKLAGSAHIWETQRRYGGSDINAIGLSQK